MKRLNRITVCFLTIIMVINISCVNDENGSNTYNTYPVVAFETTTYQAIYFANGNYVFQS